MGLERTHFHSSQKNQTYFFYQSLPGLHFKTHEALAQGESRWLFGA